MVDIGTEWNLEIGKYLCASKHTYVDIGTEWNLEPIKINWLLRWVYGRYRNRVEFRVASGGRSHAMGYSRYRNRVEFRA